MKRPQLLSEAYTFKGAFDYFFSSNDKTNKKCNIHITYVKLAVYPSLSLSFSVPLCGEGFQYYKKLFDIPLSLPFHMIYMILVISAQVYPALQCII